MAAAAPSTPRLKHIRKKLCPKNQIVLIKNHIMAKKRVKQLVIINTTVNQPTTEKINIIINLQIKVLINLVISLLGTLEE